MSTIPASCALGSGKAGLTIGYRVLSKDRDEVAAFTALNVVETAVPGTYAVTGGANIGSEAEGYIEWGTDVTKYAESEFVLGAQDAATSGDVDAAETAILAAIASIASITADDVLDEAVEGTLTLRQAVRVLLAFAAGLASGGGTTTIKYRDVANTRDRLTLVVDASGNRTSSTLDVS